MLSSSHNLHAYDEFQLAWSHYPLPAGGDAEAVLAGLYPALSAWLKNGERVLIHQDELGDRLMGVIAGYLRWSGILPDRPRAITVVEQLLKRQMGSAGRTIVALVETLPGAAPSRPEEPAQPEEGAGPGDAGGKDAGGKEKGSRAPVASQEGPRRPKRTGAAVTGTPARARKAAPARSAPDKSAKS